jgi:hypothetical protein
MFRRIKAKQQAAAKVSPDNRLTAICGGCGEQYEYQCIHVTPRKRRFCSDSCYQRQRQGLGMHYMQGPAERPCRGCGSLFNPIWRRRVWRAYCSKPCYQLRKSRDAWARGEEQRKGRRREARAARAADEIRAFQESPPKCADCGCDQAWELRRRMRCAACQKKHNSASVMRSYYTNPETRRKMLDAAKRRSHRRRAQGAGEDVSWREVMERDGWKCRRCGVKTSEEHRMGHPRKAVLGHIYALSAGGEHSYANVCCLCHSCNVADGVNKVAIQYHLEVASHG